MTSTRNLKRLLLAGSILFALPSFAQTLDDALKLSRSEEFEKANKALDALISSKPTNGTYYFYLGENFFDWERQDSAKAAYQKAVTLDPTNALGYVGVGKIQWYNGDSKSAVDNFYKATVLSKSKDATVLAKIAEVYINAPTKDIAKAIDLLTQAMGLDPNNEFLNIDMGDAYLARNDGSNAVTYYQKATSINPKSALGTLRLGQLWGRARNYDLSFQKFKEAAQIDSNFAPAYREKAEMLGAAQRYDEAIAQYQKYLQLNNSLSARSRYAKFLFLAKKYKESVNEAQKVMAQDTTDVILYRVLSYSQYETGDFKNGLNTINKFFTKASKANTKIIPSDYAYQGKLLSKNGQDSLAIIKLKQAIKDGVTEGAGDIYSTIGNLYFKNSKDDSAVVYLRARTHMPQVSANDYYYLGRALYDAKKYQVADSAFGVIVKYLPDLPLGYQWRAYCNEAIDSATTQGLAKPFFEQYIGKAAKDSLKNKDGLVNAYNYLGFYYIKNKDLNKEYEQATYYYKKTLELDPNNGTATQGLKNIKTLKEPPKKAGVK